MAKDSAPFEEVRGIDLGDARRNRRAELVAARLDANRGHSLPKAFPDDAELEGTYRLLGNEHVEPQALLLPHIRRGVERAAFSNAPLVAVHDTTEVKFSGEYSREGLGVLPNGGQGFMAHVSLLVAMREESRDPLGVVQLETLFRDEPKKVRRSGYAISEADESEGLRWGRGIEAVESVLGEGAAVHVFDREGDAYLLHAQLQSNGARYVVRSKYDRRCAQEGDAIAQSLWEGARETREIRVSRTVRLSARHSGELKGASKKGGAALKGAGHKRTPAGKKTHPARVERAAELHISASQHVLRKPNVEGRPCASELPINVVRVFEVNAPENCAPVEWILLTNEPIESDADVAAVVDVYRARWLIEELFKALKTGCGFEKLQLEGRHSLKNALAIYLPVAWRLLRLRTLAQTAIASATDVLTPVQLRLIRHMAPKARLSETPTAREALLAVAAIGGHIKNNGEPGWQVIGRGFEDLLRAELGYWAARAEM